jgi:hypothetical protein
MPSAISLILVCIASSMSIKGFRISSPPRLAGRGISQYMCV